VRTQTHDVLHEQLVIGQSLARIVVHQLQAYAREFTGVVIRHPGEPHRVKCVIADNVTRDGCPHAGSARIEPVIPHTGAPVRHELVHTLQVPAALRDFTAAGICEAVSQHAISLALEIFALHLEVTFADIAIGRVFPDKIQSRSATVAGEAVGRPVGIPSESTALLTAFSRLVSCSETPARQLFSMPISSPTRRIESAASLAADFDEHVGRCQPFQLHAVLAQPVVPHHAIHQRLINKIPYV
jgi:hypothetical protein